MRLDIKDKIKEAFNGRRNLKSKWSQYSQVNIYALDIFMQKAGYHLVDILEHDDLIELIIEPIKEGYLHPEIIHNFEEGVYYINVKKYGELLPEEVHGVIKGYENALGIVAHLEEIDLSKLEIGHKTPKDEKEEDEE